jgi:hypothetical protein
MKATELSQGVADLIAILTRKQDALDDSPLGNHMARYLAKVISNAQTSDCHDEEAASEVEASLDEALKIWRQYENSRSSQSGTTE